VRIIAVPAPPTDVAPDWEWTWAYEGYSRIRRAIELETWGHSDSWAPTPILMAFLAESPWRRVVLRVAVRDDVPAGAGVPDDVLGVAEVGLPSGGDAHVGMVHVAVDPASRRHGVGTALADAADEVLVTEGRTVALAWSAQAPEPAPGDGVVTAPTGAGRVDLADGRARFAVGRGFALEQVTRASRLDVPRDTTEVERLGREAAERAGEDYKVHLWNRTVPPDYHAALAVLWSRMNTDAPSGGLDIPEDEWDAERVAVHLERQANAQQQVLIAAAEHVPTGALAAFTTLAVPEPDVDFGFQDDTLVLPEHRGHRLGMLVKAANLVHLIQLRPRVRRIHTINAEENRYMLAINVALGFRGAGVIASWQKTLGSERA
jgi:GNAT superfamily N-acetyltransferase